MKSQSILIASPSLQAVSNASENALPESESALFSSRIAWEHLKVLESTSQVNGSIWEICMRLSDQFTFCWCWLLSFFDILFHWNHTNIAVVYSTWVLAATPQTHITGTWYDFVSTTRNIVVFNQVGPQPSKAKADLHIDYYNDRPEKYYRNPNTSIVDDKGQVDETAG